MKKYLPVFIAVIILWFTCWSLMIYFFSNDQTPWEHRGQFGDMFGSLNALFSGLAFAGIIATILLQREELQLQRQELQATRQEFNQQNATMTRQRFDNTFFNMLSIHYQTLDGLRLGDRTDGRKVIQFFLQQIRQSLLGDYTLNELPYFKSRYNEHLQKHYHALSYYLQSLESLYVLIKTSISIEENEREFYYRILKSYISYPERILLFYHVALSNPTALNDNLRYMENDLLIVGTVAVQDLFNETHIKLLGYRGTSAFKVTKTI